MGEVGARAGRRIPAEPFLILALLFYWALSLHRLDALPTVREDEPWQTAPGYSLWTTGVFGSELYADFDHAALRYYEFLPSFPILLGLTARVAGLGLYQIRMVPVMLGALTLCLTFAAGAKIGGRKVGVLAAGLELLWRWGVSTPLLASGVPLLDESRIARYDALVPVWGLAALIVFVQATRRERGTLYFFAGALAGLGGLAHLYGLFWLGLFGLVILLRGVKPFEPTLYLVGAGALAVWLPYLVYIGLGWPDFVAQVSNYRARFDLLNPSFYLNNLRHEPQRYWLGRTTIAAAVLQPGVWLLALGVPAAWLLLCRRARADRDLALTTLACAALFFPAAFGLLLWQKIPGYLLSILPLFAIVVAWGGVCVWRGRRESSSWTGGKIELLRPLLGHNVRRKVLAAGLLLLTLDSASGIVTQWRAAEDATSYYTFMTRVRAIVPLPARVLALHQYWPGLAANDFRSYTDAIFLSSPEFTLTPIPLDQALERISPQVVILDSILGDVLWRGHDPAEPGPEYHEFATRVDAFMARHAARELGRVQDKTYGVLVVYGLSP